MGMGPSHGGLRGLVPEPRGFGLDGFLRYLHEPQDLFPLLAVLPRQETQRGTFRPGPGRAAHPVDIVLGIARQVVIDHVGDMVDVQTPGGDVGGH